MLLPLFALLSCGKSQPVLTKEETRLNEKIRFNPAILLKLREYTQEPVKQLVIYTNDYYVETGKVASFSSPHQAMVFGVSKEEGQNIMAKMAGFLKGKGYLVFKRHDGFGMGKDSVAILKSNDQFEIPRIMGTAGPNYDIYNKDVVARLKKWHTVAPFTITGASEEWVEAIFVTQPADMNAFAREVYAFCPDIVDQGTGDVEALAEEMKAGNTLYLWWD